MIIDLLKRVDDMLRMTEERCIFLMFNFKGQGQLDILIKEKNYFNHGIHVHAIVYAILTFLLQKLNCRYFTFYLSKQ